MHVRSPPLPYRGTGQNLLCPLPRGDLFRVPAHALPKTASCEAAAPARRWGRVSAPTAIRYDEIAMSSRRAFLTLVLLAVASVPLRLLAQQPHQAPSILIRGGTLVDGTGVRPRRADVRISGDRVE